MRKRTHPGEAIRFRGGRGSITNKTPQASYLQRAVLPVSAKEKRALCDMKSYIGPPHLQKFLENSWSIKELCTASIKIYYKIGGINSKIYWQVIFTKNCFPGTDENYDT